MNVGEQILVATVGGLLVILITFLFNRLRIILATKYKEMQKRSEYVKKELRYIAFYYEATDYIYQYARGELSLADLDNIKGWLEEMYFSKEPDIKDLKETYDFEYISDINLGDWTSEDLDNLSNIDAEWKIAAA